MAYDIVQRQKRRRFGVSERRRARYMGFVSAGKTLKNREF
jgi:hypothetical protein